MVLGDERIRGGLICVSTKDNVDFRWGEGTISKKYLEFYVETLAHIVSILAMVLGRHAAEEQRIASQAVRSHELVAPVHAIRGFHDNLSFMFKHEIKKKAEGLSHPDALEQFEKQLDRLGDLCRLLGLVATACSIEETGTFQQTDFMRGIVFPVVPPLHAYALAQKKTKVRYSREFFEVPRVWVSEEGIKRCIFNLVLNAVKYANRRSTVRVDVNIGGEYFDILVVNEGIGVPAGEEEKIFERFRQGSNARKVAAYGAGIGLYVSRTIARAHGGDVKLVDASQESTTFRLRLPRSLEDEPGLDIEGARS